MPNNQGGRHWEAELHRLKGELRLARTAEHDREAETCCRHALDVTRRQQGKSLELRAALGLSRPWYRQDEHEDASKLLARIYGWFTKSVNATILQETKALLDEWS